MTQVTAIDAYWLGKLNFLPRNVPLLTVAQPTWDLCFTLSGRRTLTMVVRDAGQTGSSQKEPSWRTRSSSREKSESY